MTKSIGLLDLSNESNTNFFKNTNILGLKY